MTTDDQAKIGQTPQGQTTAEIPRTSAPGGHNAFGLYSPWLAHPEQRYGQLVSALHIPTNIKLEMLADPVLQMCAGFTGAALVKAERVIECADEGKRRFFAAMFRVQERDFMRKANMALALGSIGLIKRWTWQTPSPPSVDDPPVWTNRATPFIIKGFDIAYPHGSAPRFTRNNRTFIGMETPDGPIDVFYSLWLTLRQADAFGAYDGVGRLRACYKDWWMKQFARDLYLVGLQKEADRITKVGYPPGKTAAGKDHRDIAVDIGNAARSGSTVALPTTRYADVDEATGEESMTNVQKWTLDFVEGGASFAKFHEIDDHHDAKMALGYLVPPQAFMNVKQSALGGPTTADVLTRLAEDLLLQDAQDIDRHINKYWFEPVSRLNFSPDSPPVRVRTVDLHRDVSDDLREIFKTLAQGSDEPQQYFDFRQALTDLGMPTRDADEAPEPEPQGDAGPVGMQAADEPRVTEEEREQAARRLGETLTEPDPVRFTGDEVAEALGDLLDAVPELRAAFDLDDIRARGDALGLLALGGPGSGHWGHRGRPGQRGGSLPRGAGMSIASGKDWLERYKKATGRAYDERVGAVDEDKGKPDTKYRINIEIENSKWSREGYRIKRSVARILHPDDAKTRESQEDITIDGQPAPDWAIEFVKRVTEQFNGPRGRRRGAPGYNNIADAIIRAMQFEKDGRRMKSRYPGRDKITGESFSKGDEIIYSSQVGTILPKTLELILAGKSPYADPGDSD